MRLAPLALCLALAACATDPAPADAPPEASGEAADTLARPDALVPQGENLAVPTGWTVRTDDPEAAAVVGADSTADIVFVNMTPGWHVTTGPAAIFYHPASTASGAYRVESTIHLFDPEGRNEAYGILIGGTDLEGDEQAYDYFLIRDSGEFILKRRTGETTQTIVDWTPGDAIVRYDDTSEGNVTNTLAVEVDRLEAAFFVNGEEAIRIPSEALQTGGIVGLRANHALDLHVESFSVSDL